MFWEWISTFEFLNKVSKVLISSFSCLLVGFFFVFRASLQGVVGGLWLVGGWVFCGRQGLWMGGLIRIMHSPKATIEGRCRILVTPLSEGLTMHNRNACLNPKP